MEIGDVPGWIAGLGALVVLFFAGRQLQLLRPQWEFERQIEKRGVAMMWRAHDVPTGADPDGTSAANYEFTAYNPGKLPVRDVDVRVDMPVEVHREHFDRSLDEATGEILLDTPSSPGASNSHGSGGYGSGSTTG